MADPIPVKDAAQVPAAANGAPAEDELYPYPEILDDWNWLFDEYESGRLEPYLGKYVAVFEKKVLGGGDDPEALRQEFGTKLGVDPDRFVVMFIGGWFDW